MTPFPYTGTLKTPRHRTTILKSINGKRVTHQQFTEAILAAVSQRGEARPVEVAGDIGWADTPERVEIVARQMNNMLRQRWLAREKRGVYSLPRNHAFQLRNRRLEYGIVHAIRSFGGLATWSQIMDHYGTLPSKNKEGIYFDGRGGGAQVQIWKAMQASKRITRYRAAGKVLWGLPWEELLTLPLTGRNAEYLMLYEFGELLMRGRKLLVEEKDLRATIEEHFSRVGGAFTSLRDRYNATVAEIADHPPIHDALDTMRSRLSGAFIENVRDEMRAEAESKAASDDARFHELLEEEIKRFPVHILDAFERGHAQVHRVAPPEFYTAYAALFGVCPASLSRGLVAKLLTPTDKSEQDEPEAVDGTILERTRPVAQERPHQQVSMG